MIRLLIADDHLMFREGIRRLLTDESDITVVSEAADYTEVISRIRNHPVDVAVLDLSMPGRDGFEMIAHVKALQPKLPILILTMHVEEQYAMRALRAGASGYLTKDNAAEELVSAVRRLAAGGEYLCAMVAERLALGFSRHDAREQLHTRLSNREYKVFEMLAAGKSASAIASELSLSVKTVSTHKIRLMSKMNMSNLAELIRYAITCKLVAG